MRHITTGPRSLDRGAKGKSNNNVQLNLLLGLNRRPYMRTVPLHIMSNATDDPVCLSYDQYLDYKAGTFNEDSNR